jgi:hypothetical protein
MTIRTTYHPERKLTSRRLISVLGPVSSSLGPLEQRAGRPRALLADRAVIQSAHAGHQWPAGPGLALWNGRKGKPALLALIAEAGCCSMTVSAARARAFQAGLGQCQRSRITRAEPWPAVTASRGSPLVAAPRGEPYQSAWRWAIGPPIRTVAGNGGSS